MISDLNLLGSDLFGLGLTDTTKIEVEDKLGKRIEKLLSGNFDETFREKYRVVDSGSYKYDPDVISRRAYKVARNFINFPNIGFMICRQQSTFDFQHVLITKHLVDICTLSSQTKETGYLFPLYLYPEDTDSISFASEQGTRTPNLNPDAVKKFSEVIGLQFGPEKTDDRNIFTPIDLLDYISRPPAATK